MSEDAWVLFLQNCHFINISENSIRIPKPTMPYHVTAPAETGCVSNGVIIIFAMPSLNPFGLSAHAASDIFNRWQQAAFFGIFLNGNAFVFVSPAKRTFHKCLYKGSYFLRLVHWLNVCQTILIQPIR